MNMQPGQSRQLEQRGFTLIELMIAAAIVAILATIAVPSYQKYQLKTNRPQGEQCLVEAQRRIEDAYAHLNQYPGADLSSYGYSTATTSCGDSKSLYTISLTWPGGYSAAANTYTLTATPVGTQVKDGTLTLTYNSQTLNPSQRLLKQHIPSGSTTAVASWDFQPGQ